MIQSILRRGTKYWETPWEIYVVGIKRFFWDDASASWWRSTIYRCSPFFPLSLSLSYLLVFPDFHQIYTSLDSEPSSLFINEKYTVADSRLSILQFYYKLCGNLIDHCDRLNLPSRIPLRIHVIRNADLLRISSPKKNRIHWCTNQSKKTQQPLVSDYRFVVCWQVLPNPCAARTPIR